MNKRLIALLLVLLMTVCLLPANAFAAVPPEISTYSIRDRAVNGLYHIMIRNVEYTVPSGTLLANDGGAVYNEYTRTAQRKLIEVSESSGQAAIDPGSPDGYFGNNTAFAAEAFQRYWNSDIRFIYSEGSIGVDGMIGGETWSAFAYYYVLS